MKVLLCLRDSLWVGLAHLSAGLSMLSSHPALWNSACGALGGKEDSSDEPHGGTGFPPPRSLCPFLACWLRPRLGIRAWCTGFTINIKPHIPPESPLTQAAQLWKCAPQAGSLPVGGPGGTGEPDFVREIPRWSCVLRNLFRLQRLSCFDGIFLVVLLRNQMTASFLAQQGTVKQY